MTAMLTGPGAVGHGGRRRATEDGGRIRFAPSRLLATAMELGASPLPRRVDATQGRTGSGSGAGAGAPDGLTTPRRALVLALAGITALTEAAFVAGIVPGLHMADLDLSIAILPALVLGVACGARLLGRSTRRRAAVAYWLLAAVMLPALAYAFAHIHRIGWYSGLLAAALGEELIYRLAIPAVIAAALRIGGVRPTGARIAGLAGAGLWFVLLPGHREQMTSLATALPFVAFAALAAVIVYRSGSILPMAIGHAISNLLTVLMWQHGITPPARSIALGFALALLLMAYGKPSRITLGDDGELVDTQTGLLVTAIDLRDGQPATVELVDGRVLPVHTQILRPHGLPVRELVDAEPDPVPPDLRALADQARRSLRRGRQRTLTHWI